MIEKGLRAKSKSKEFKVWIEELIVYATGGAIWFMLYDAVTYKLKQNRTALGHLLMLISLIVIIYIVNSSIAKIRARYGQKVANLIVNSEIYNKYQQAIYSADAIIWEWPLLEMDSLKIVFDGSVHQEGQNINFEDAQTLRKHLEGCKSGKISQFECEHRIRNDNGEFSWFISRGKVVLDENKSVYKVVGMSFDITMRRMEEIKLHDLALRDSLTGLLNRVSFSKKVLEVINLNLKSDKKAALLFLDLDDFKSVNDRWGHDVGDAFLIETARRLKKCVRGKDSVVRIGGDEFAILLEDIMQLDEIESILTRIQEAFNEPYSISGCEISATISTGVAILPDDGETLETLMKFADLDMYRLKRERKNNSHNNHVKIQDEALSDRIMIKRKQEEI